MPWEDGSRRSLLSACWPERIFRSSPCIRILMKDSVPLYRLVAIISVILLLALVEMGWR